MAGGDDEGMVAEEGGEREGVRGGEEEMKRRKGGRRGRSKVREAKGLKKREGPYGAAEETKVLKHRLSPLEEAENYRRGNKNKHRRELRLLLN